MEIAARIGWLSRGVLYVLVAVLVARLPSTGSAEKVDKGGAFAILADSRFGGWLLGTVAVGLAGFAIWRMWAAVRGTREKPNRRLGWVVSAVVYAGLSVLAFGVLLGRRGSGGNDEKTLTAEVLGWRGGQVIVGLAGLLVLAVAGNSVRKGVKERFLHDVDVNAVPRTLRRAVTAVGVAGWLGRALVWGLVGWFLLRAAVQHDPNEPVGLDESLRAVVGEGWGVVVIWAAFGGLLAYGLLCFATATWPDPEPDSGG